MRACFGVGAAVVRGAGAVICSVWQRYVVLMRMGAFCTLAPSTIAVWGCRAPGGCNIPTSLCHVSLSRPPPVVLSVRCIDNTCTHIPGKQCFLHSQLNIFCDKSERYFSSTPASAARAIFSNGLSAAAAGLGRAWCQLFHGDRES